MAISRKKALAGIAAATALAAGAAVPLTATATGPYPEELDGRMTGGGKWFPNIPEYQGFVTHGFTLHCNLAKPNNLQVNWEGGNRFHLTELTSAQCTDDPNINPLPRTAPFDTFRGTGIGRYNGQDGAKVDFKLTDAGEPGKRDKIRVQVRYQGQIVLQGSPARRLTFGNHQAHPNNKDN